MLMKVGGNFPFKTTRHKDAFSKFDHFLINTFTGGHAEASSHSKLPLIWCTENSKVLSHPHNP